MFEKYGVENTEDGVIFISLDDNEVVNMKKVCDEIFSASNFVGQITVVGNPRGRDYGGVARMHDYILVYKKSNQTELNLIEDSESEFKMFDALGGFELRELRNRNIKFNKENRPNLYYPFYINPDVQDEYGLHPISVDPVEGWIELYPLASQGVNTVWRWGKSKAIDNLNINICAKPMKNGSYMIVEKYKKLIETNKDKKNENAKNIEKIAIHDVYTVTDKVKDIFRELIKSKKFVFGKLFSLKEKPKAEVVTAFSGVLELSRRNKVYTNQSELFGDITVTKRKIEEEN